jgi:hypothetical protein
MRLIHLRTFLCCFLSVGFSAATLAESYQTELNFGFEKHQPDEGLNSEVLSLYGEHHFNRVEAAAYPYEEAAFISKSSYAFGGFAQTNPGDYAEQWGGVAYYVPNSVVYLEGTIKRYQTDEENRGNDFGGALGVRLFDGLLLTTRYWDEQGYDANLHAKIVHQLAGGNFINLLLGYTDMETDAITEVGFDAYFDRSFSAGLGYVDNMGRNEYEVRVQKYVTNVAHLSAALVQDPDETFLKIEVGVRF